MMLEHPLGQVLVFIQTRYKAPYEAVGTYFRVDHRSKATAADSAPGGVI
jgi:hypothetical protein